MKSNKILYFVIIILIIINVGFVIQFNLKEGPDHPHRPPHPPKNELVDYLGANGETRTFILKEQEKHFTKKTRLIDAHRKAQKKLISTYLEPKDSLAFLKQFQNISDLQYAIELENYRYFNTIAQKLNTAQKEKLNIFLHELFQKPGPPKRPR